MIVPPARLDDDAWADLLDFIEERRVIPIVGPELLKVETETGPRLFYDWVAEKLAAKLNVDTAHLPAGPALTLLFPDRGSRQEKAPGAIVGSRGSDPDGGAVSGRTPAGSATP